MRTEIYTNTICDGETIAWGEEPGRDRYLVHRRVFDRLARWGAPKIRRYHSDLWHDMEWLKDHLDIDGCEFWFGADDSGTAIGYDERDVRRARRYVVKVQLVKNTERSDRFELTITEVGERQVVEATYG